MVMEKALPGDRIVRVTIAMLSGARHFFDMKMSKAKDLETAYREVAMAHLLIASNGASYTISTRGIESFVISNRPGE